MAFGVHGNKRGEVTVIDEQDTHERNAHLWVIAAGAVAGALVGYALRTARGRRAFDEAIGILDDFTTGCVRFSEACTRAQIAASDGWHAVTAIGSKSTRSR